MRTITLPMPKFGFIVGTRAALGAGIALLIAGKLMRDRRRHIGIALTAIGAITTLPALKFVRRGVRRVPVPSPVLQDDRLIGATRYAHKGDEAID